MPGNDNRSKIIIDGDDRGARRVLGNTTQGLKSVESAAMGMRGGLLSGLQSISSMASSLPTIVAGGTVAVVGLFASIIKSNIDMEDALSKSAQQIGTTTEFLSTFGYAAELAGVEQESLNTSLLKFNRNLADTADGTGEAKEAFKALGISVKDSEGNLISTEAAMNKIADGFAKLPDGAKKTQIAMDLFGRSGAAMIPLLNSGSASIEELRQQARDLGLEIDSSRARMAEYINDSITVLQKKFEGVGIALTDELMPTLVVLADYLVDVFTTMEGGIGILDVVGFGFKALTSSFIIANTNLRTLITLVTGAFEIMKAFAEQGVAAAALEAEKAGKDIADTWSNTGDSLSQIWESPEESAARFQERLKEIQQERAIEDAAKAAEKLAKEWEKVSAGLTNDIAKAKLSEVDYQFYQINQKVEELEKKFGKKKLISEYGDALKKDLIDKLTQLPDISDEDISISLGINDDSFNEWHKQYMADKDAEIEKAIEQAKKEKELAELRKKVGMDSLSKLADASMNFYQLSDNNNKAALVAYKAFATAETLINTYDAAMAAYKAMVGIPVVGPGLAVAAAAAASLYGASQIANIMSVQPGSTGGGSASASVVTPTSYNGGSSGGRSSDGERPQDITIIIQSNVFDQKTWDDVAPKMIEAINNEYGRGRRILGTV